MLENINLKQMNEQIFKAFNLSSTWSRPNFLMAKKISLNSI